MAPVSERIQLCRARGWRMPTGAVKVDRTTKWGNPFVVGVDGSAAECVDLYSRAAAATRSFAVRINSRGSEDRSLALNSSAK